MSNIRYKILLVLILSITLSISYIYIFKNPVLLRIYNFGIFNRTTNAPPQILILNPFRDQILENISEKFLTTLKEGKCAESLLKTTISSERKIKICSEHEKYPLKKWQLIDWQYKSSDIILTYHHWSGESKEPGEIKIFINKQNQTYNINGITISY